MGAFQGISAAVGQLTAASNAGFTVSDEGGQALLNAIDTLHTKVVGHLRKAGELTQVLPLGSSPAANTYKPFLSTIASDPVQGAVPVLKQLKQDLETAHDAIQKNMASYQQTEQRNASSVKSQGIWT